jgi:hypothetical protein
MKFPNLRELPSIDTFIGHSNKDKNYADAIFFSLRRLKPIIPYMAEYYPNFGEDYKNRIMSQLDKSVFVIFILTQNAVQSQWVNQEIGYVNALKRHKNSPFPLIIPIANKNVELTGLLTKDSIDLLFIEDCLDFNWVIAAAIRKIRSNLQDGLKYGALKVQITCQSCRDKHNLPFEFENGIMEDTLLSKAHERGIIKSSVTCPRCNQKIILDNRTWDLIQPTTKQV